jgi:hypothetical protein
VLSLIWAKFSNFLRGLFVNRELQYLKELHQESLRQAETQIGFLRSQIEYLQSTQDSLLRTMHINAGLLSPDAPANPGKNWEPINSGPGGWDAARIGLERKYAKEEKARTDGDKQNEYWKAEAARNQHVIDESTAIVGDFVPEDNKRSN